MSNLLVTLIPACPLLACLLIALFGPKVFGEKSHLVTIAGNAGACALSWLSLATLLGGSQPWSFDLYTWMNIPASDQVAALSIPICFHLDSMSAIMLSMLTFIATLVAIYAGGYMHGDPGYPRFFACVSLFTFSMIMLVLSGSFLQLFMFWEAVGLCSYLLIGFWFEKPSASAAGMKAFVVNRIGDFGFAIGIFLIWTTFGSIKYDETLFNAAAISRVLVEHPGLFETICICLFAGAIGKSAQFPLHVWLPDAMEGPTPVSALIHAATMVTAGVYMVARCTPFYEHAPYTQLVISLIGGVTALLAALTALTQTDLKRVLAYSTVSQLGYMFMGLGTGSMLGIAGAMFHLVTHAFFKALLFLGAGSVMHAMGGVIDMRQFSGLRKLMPHTYRTFVIGSLALAGLFPLSGFWSKDIILSAVRHAGQGHAAAHENDTHGTAAHAATDGHGEHADEAHGHTVAAHADHPKPVPAPIKLLGVAGTTWYTLLFWMGTLTAFLTAFYTFRGVFLTFHGEERIPPEAGHHAHESPPSMTVPLMILAVGAAALGAVFGHATGWFDGFLDLTLHGVAGHHPTDWVVVGLSTVAAVAGIGLAYVLYALPSPIPRRLAEAAPPLYQLSYNKFFLDELYFALILVPTLCLAQLSRFLDWALVDGLVNFVGSIPGALAKLARPIQNGLVQFYALSMMLALAMLLWALVYGPILSNQG